MLYLTFNITFAIETQKVQLRVVLILGQRRRQWYKTKSTGSHKSKCVLGTLKTISFDKQIYIYLKVQKLSVDFWSLKIWILKYEVQSQKNSNSKWLPRNPSTKFQSLCHNKNNRTKIKISDKKLTQPSPNIIVTWEVTIPL